MDNRAKIFCVFLTVFFGTALFIVPPVLAASKKPIRFTDVSWDSAQGHNRIAGFIVKNGYGYDRITSAFTAKQR